MRIRTKGVRRKTMNLAKGTFADDSVEVEVIERDLSREIDGLGGCTAHEWIVGREEGEKRGWLDKDRWLIRDKERSLCQTRQPEETAGCVSHVA
jgi:hypothetical protein